MSGLIGFKDACNVALEGLSSHAIEAYLNYANTFSLDLKADTVYAMGKGSRRIAWDKPLEGTVTISTEMTTSQWIALLLGAGVITTGVDVFRREVLPVTEGKVTLTKGTPLVGSLTVAVLDEDMVSHSSILEAVATTPADATEYKISDNDITVDVSLNGKELTCYYLINVATAKSFTVKSNGDKGYYKMYADLEGKSDATGAIEYKQLQLFKVSPQKNFKFDFNADSPAKFDMVFDLLANAEDKMLKWVDIE
jgi:hypothetical protein